MHWEAIGDSGGRLTSASGTALGTYDMPESIGSGQQGPCTPLGKKELVLLFMGGNAETGESTDTTGVGSFTGETRG